MVVTAERRLVRPHTLESKVSGNLWRFHAFHYKESNSFFFCVQTENTVHRVELLRLRGEDYREAHLSTSLRASSAGIPSALRASWRAMFIPARSSIWRTISWRGVFSGSFLTRSMTISRLLMG